MIHNETANIWTHLVGLAIFVAITASMVFGWGGTPMPALPDTWVTGANATRVALVARTVQFRENIEASRALLLGLASGLGDGGDQSGGGGLAGGGFGSRIGGAVGEGYGASTQSKPLEGDSTRTVSVAEASVMDQICSSAPGGTFSLTSPQPGDRQRAMAMELPPPGTSPAATVYV